jgi:hypothetical protein
MYSHVLLQSIQGGVSDQRSIKKFYNANAEECIIHARPWTEWQSGRRLRLEVC